MTTNNERVSEVDDIVSQLQSSPLIRSVSDLRNVAKWHLTETKTLRAQRDLAHKDKDVYLNAACEAIKSNNELTLKLEQAQAENVRLQERMKKMNEALEYAKEFLWQNFAVISSKIDEALAATPATALEERYQRMEESLIKCRNAIEGYKMTNRLHEESVLNLALIASKQVLATNSDKDAQ